MQLKNRWSVLFVWNAGCWNDSKARTWKDSAGGTSGVADCLKKSFANSCANKQHKAKARLKITFVHGHPYGPIQMCRMFVRNTAIRSLLTVSICIMSNFLPVAPMYIYVCICVCVYIYIYRERETNTCNYTYSNNTNIRWLRATSNEVTPHAVASSRPPRGRGAI